MSMLHDELRAEKMKVIALTEKLKQSAKKRVPFAPEVHATTRSTDCEDLHQSVEWAYQITLAALNWSAKRFIDIHPFDAELFKMVYTSGQENRDSEYLGLTRNQAIQVQAILNHRYRDTIQVALCLGPFEKYRD
jgi:hypothetical protein